ncbi:hypothetical protein EIQ03_18100 [Xanthomonas campestris pv. raphani]
MGEGDGFHRSAPGGGVQGALCGKFPATTNPTIQVGRAFPFTNVHLDTVFTHLPKAFNRRIQLDKLGWRSSALHVRTGRPVALLIKLYT